MIPANAGSPLLLTFCHAPYDGIRPAFFLQLGHKGPQVSNIKCCWLLAPR